MTPREVETFAKQIYANEDVVLTCTESVENLDTVEGLDIAVYICCLYLEFEEIFV